MSAGALVAPAPLHSPQWFRVAQLRPCLDVGAQVRRQIVRGQRWHILQRADGLRSVRLNATAWAIIGRCDGQVTLQRLWEWSLREAGDAAPTQDELLDLVTRLTSAGLLSVDRAAERGLASDDASGAAAEGDGPARRQSWLAWRVPLGCPDAWLARVAQVVAPCLIGPAAPLVATALALLMLLALMAVAWNGQALLVQAGALLTSPRGLWLAALVYPLMKLVHEAAHGTVARLHGVAVPQWGVSFLMFMPVPYVEVSAASALPRSGQRVAVAVAGIAVELTAAALGVLLASNVQPGLVQDLGLMALVVGALSSLAVNANPLLRFDGYHVLCDAAGLPNLALRSQRWWLQRLQHRLLGVALAQPLLPAPGERPWLWAYAPAALAMRWTVSVALVMWLAGVSALAAAGVAAGLLWGLVVKPLVAGWRAWSRSALPPDLRHGAQRRLMLVAVLPILLTCFVPWPDRTVVQGVWWLPESALVRNEVDGFVAEVLAEDGQMVQAGDVLLRLDAPALQAEAAQWQARVAALQTEHWQALNTDPSKAAQLEYELSAARASAVRAQESIEQRLVRAGVSGRLVLGAADDLPGRWLTRGRLVAHIVTGEPGLVRVVIPHERAALVAQSSPTVDLRRASTPGPVIAGRWEGQLSGANDRLPSRALGDRAGGALPVDPTDDEGTRALHRVVLADILPPPTATGADADADAAGAHRIGERVWVRFDHGLAPLAWQFARALQQLVLRHLRAGS